uniref:Uncharacterized protein n=1 Tax=uncultured marine virus TaxID=186617 RepID=A0A0F7L7J9_9VIRU|nr:hypothetical protein [uncultured marine virus]
MFNNCIIIYVLGYYVLPFLKIFQPTTGHDTLKPFLSIRVVMYCHMLIVSEWYSVTDQPACRLVPPSVEMMYYCCITAHQ